MSQHFFSKFETLRARNYEPKYSRIRVLTNGHAKGVIISAFSCNSKEMTEGDA